MEEKRKIVIPIAEPETPQFDAEETLMSARPVVPLSARETHREFGGANASTPARAPFYRRFPFLALIVLAAASLGLAGGLGIARYRYQQRVAAPVAAQPVTTPSDARTAAVTPKEKENTQAQAPQAPEVKVEEKASNGEESAKDGATDKDRDAKDKATDASAEKSSNDEKADETAKATKPTVRDKNRSDEDVDNENTPRVQRKDRRQRDKRGDDDALDVPRQIERANERINKIREIFEGTTQP